MTFLECTLGSDLFVEPCASAPLVVVRKKA